MIKKMRGGVVLFSAVAALFAMFAWSGAAMAQTQKILVIDQARLVKASKAGQAIATQAKTMQTKFNKEIAAERAKAKQAGEKYKKNKEVYSPEQRKTELEKLRKLGIKLRGLQVQRTRELQLAVAGGEKQILDALRPIISDIVKERKATLLLDTFIIMYADNSINITDEAMKRLDAKLKTVKLQKVAAKAPKKK